MLPDVNVLFDDGTIKVWADGCFTLQSEEITTVSNDAAALVYLATLLAAKSNKKGIKADGDKPHLSILPSEVLCELLRPDRAVVPDAFALARAVSNIADVMDAESVVVKTEHIAFKCLARCADEIVCAMQVSTPVALGVATRVMMHGARKYAVDNWRQLRPSRRYADAALRHIFAHIGGEQNDAETQLPHLAHALCCVVFLMHHALRVKLDELREHHDYGLPTQAQLVRK